MLRSSSDTSMAHPCSAIKPIFARGPAVRSAYQKAAVDRERVAQLCADDAAKLLNDPKAARGKGITLCAHVGEVRKVGDEHLIKAWVHGSGQWVFVYMRGREVDVAADGTYLISGVCEGELIAEASGAVMLRLPQIRAAAIEALRQ